MSKKHRRVIAKPVLEDPDNMEGPEFLVPPVAKGPKVKFLSRPDVVIRTENAYADENTAYLTVTVKVMLNGDIKGFIEDMKREIDSIIEAF